MSTPPQDDGNQIVARARAGDPAAFAELYRLHASALLSFVAGRVRRREDADDIVGQVFLEAIRGIDRFDGDGANFRAWLMRIARDRAIDAGRRIDRKREEPLEAAREPASIDSAETLAMHNLESERIWSAVRALPEAQRDVITLRLGSQLSSPEIAIVLGKQVNAVKALQHRALANLARMLADPADESGPDVADGGAWGLDKTGATGANRPSKGVSGARGAPPEPPGTLV